MDKKSYFRRNWYKMLIIFVLLAVLCYVAFFWGNHVIKKRLPIKYESEVTAYAAKYDLDEKLVYAVICAESGFRADAVSSAGARGLMQLMPSTATWLVEKYGLEVDGENLFDPETNIQIGCCYLRYLYDKFESTQLVLAAYNGGEGNVSKWLEKPEYSQDGKSLTKIPFKETANYVKKVSGYYELYKKLYS